MFDPMCGTCRFWSQFYENEEKGPLRQIVGHCRRYPPTNKQDGGVQISATGWQYVRTSEFEIVTSDGDWCGEYKDAFK